VFKAIHSFVMKSFKLKKHMGKFCLKPYCKGCWVFNKKNREFLKPFGVFRTSFFCKFTFWLLVHTCQMILFVGCLVNIN
jgi:hypothetical protein